MGRKIMIGSDSIMGQELEQERLAILWTSQDREVALNMVFMYAINSKMRNWWNNICFIIWGPSAKLLSEDEELQIHIEKMIELGIEVVACKACADGYKASEKLEALGIEVKYMGEPLTKLLKEGWKTMAF